MSVRPTDIVTLRTTSLLAEDLTRAADDLASALNGTSCLVIGGAGSIGAETIEQLCRFPLKRLVVIDQDENGLARLMRRLRGRAEPIAIESVSTLPLDYGSALGEAALRREDPFDFVLNFAALKHVRSEKDVLSTFALMDTNILKQFRFLNLVSDHSPDCRYFSVSTDKAANPTSFMGATKRFMEHAIFAKAVNKPGNGVTSARFANVAYSQGSLLESFVSRLEVGVPLAAPEGINRFFMSLEEAGEFCLLAAVLGKPDHISIPTLAPETHLVSMKDAATGFLKANGFETVLYPHEDQAKAFADLPALRAEGKWPLILTPADTAGEKPYEEFAGEGETVTQSRFEALQDLHYLPDVPSQALSALLSELTRLKSDQEALIALSAEDLISLIASAEPRFRAGHIASEKSLDDRI